MYATLSENMMDTSVFLKTKPQLTPDATEGQPLSFSQIVYQKFMTLVYKEFMVDLVYKKFMVDGDNGEWVREQNIIVWLVAYVLLAVLWWVLWIFYWVYWIFIQWPYTQITTYCIHTK